MGSNGPTEAVNNLIKRVKRAAFGFTSFRNYRIRSLLYAGKPNWGLLATIIPRRIPMRHITEHPTAEGKLYLRGVKDVFSNRRGTPSTLACAQRWP